MRFWRIRTDPCIDRHGWRILWQAGLREGAALSDFRPGPAHVGRSQPQMNRKLLGSPVCVCKRGCRANVRVDTCTKTGMAGVTVKAHGRLRRHHLHAWGGRIRGARSGCSFPLNCRCLNLDPILTGGQQTVLLATHGAIRLHPRTRATSTGSGVER